MIKEEKKNGFDNRFTARQTEEEEEENPHFEIKNQQMSFFFML